MKITKKVGILLFAAMLALAPATSSLAQVAHNVHIWKCQTVGFPYVGYTEYHEIPGPINWAPGELCKISVYYVDCEKVCAGGGETQPNSKHSHSKGATHSIAHN